jgi:hypothetical protein
VEQFLLVIIGIYEQFLVLIAVMWKARSRR